MVTELNKIPFKEVNLCGTRILDVKKLIEYKGIEPLVLANGIRPRIWITVFLENGDSFSLVEDGKPKHESITVDISPSHIKVNYLDSVLINALKLREDRLAVDRLDLRPVGIELYGDESSLFFGGMQLSRADIREGGCAFSFG